jgi:metallo-beta-lactamase class B
VLIGVCVSSSASRLIRLQLDLSKGVRRLRTGVCCDATLRAAGRIGYARGVQKDPMRNICLTLATVLVLSGSLASQVKFQEPVITDPNWIKPETPFRIVGDLYYVGTNELACFLITTTDGNILVNTGVGASAAVIRANIESLGFKFSDIKLLIATHAHFDHVGAMAEIKRLTGARMLMNEADAATLEDGGNTDYRFPQGRGAVFEPVKVDQRLRHGDTFRLGGTELTAHHHPGHTKGSTSFSFVTADGGRNYSVLIANMNSVNAGVKLLDAPAYPNIIEDYAMTFARQKQLTPDVWVSSHGGMFLMHRKLATGDRYDPQRFVDPEGYRAMVARFEQLYLDQLGRERQAQGN